MIAAGVPEPLELDLPGARVAFSTRLGGVSEGRYESLNLGILTDDDPGRVVENRGRLAGAIGLDAGRVAMGWQVHGADLHEWHGPPSDPVYAAPGRSLEPVDAHVTSELGLGLLVLAADCLPVALAAPGRVAMAHAGWRGLAAGVLERAVGRLGDSAGAIEAAIGPGIGPCCYEVGDEVLAAFDDLDGVTAGRRLDLKAVARARLRAAGVPSVLDVEMCTSCRADLFFSHRRDGGLTGRQGGIVWRR